MCRMAGRAALPVAGAAGRPADRDDAWARMLTTMRLPPLSNGPAASVLATASAAQDIMARAVPAMRMMLVSSLVGLPLLALLMPMAGMVREAMVMWVMVAATAGFYGLLARGHARFVLCGLVVAFVALGIVSTAAYGSVRGSSMLAFVGAILVGGIFFGRAVLVATVVASVAAVGALILAENAGFLRAQPDFSVGAMQWLNYSVALALVGLNVGFVRSLAVDVLGRLSGEVEERRTAEKALARSEGFQQAIFRQSPAAIMITDFDDAIVVDVNEAAEQLFGMGRAQMVGRAAGEFYANPDALRGAHAALSVQGVIANLHMVLRNPDGGAPIHAMASANQIAVDGRRYAINQFVDISGELAARAEQKKSEERFAKAFEFSPIGMSISRLADGRFIEVNKAGEDTLGYTRAEILGRTFLEIGNWPSEAQRQAFVETLARDERVLGYDSRMRHKSGEYIDCRLYAERIEVAGEACILTAAINVSEQKRREHLLLSIVRGVAGETGAGFFRALAEHLGLATKADRVLIAECLGAGRLMPLAFLRDGVDATKNAPIDAQSGALARLLVDEGVRIDDSGAVWDQEVAGSLDLADMRTVAHVRLASPEGAAVGILCVFRREPFEDAPEVDALFRIFASRAEAEIMRLRAERALLAANLTLESRVRERTAQLETVNRELEAFSYSVSHDLRSPLRAIDGFANLLSENLAPVMAPEDAGMLARLRAACTRMDALIGDLLDLSRIGRVEMARQSVDLSRMLREIADQMMQAHPGRAVELSIGEGIGADCDPALTRVVFDNLIGNAWKFTRDSAPARIAFGVEPAADGGAPVYFVRDNGAGFDMRFADKLFTPFQRMHRQDEFEGTGIGLVIVQRVVARHGGRIWVTAAPGQGATFRFTLSAGA